MFSGYLFLVKSMIGTGFLFLASTAVTSGYAVSGFLLTLMAFVAFIAMQMIAVVSFEIGGDDISFFRACEVLAPRMKYVTDLSVAGSYIFVLAAYLIVFGDQLSQVITEEKWFMNLSQKELCIILKCALVVISAPMCYAQKMIGTSITNAIGMLCLIYVYSMCFVYADLTTHVEISALPDSFPATLSALTTMLLVYNVHGSMFSFLNNVRSASLKSISVTCASVSITGYLIYLPAMILPYLTYGRSVTPNFLSILPSGDFPVKIAKALLALSVALTFPILVHPVRRSTNVVLFKTGKTGLRNRLLVTTAILIISLICAVFLFKYLEPIINIAGLLGGNTMCFLMPAFLYRRAHKARPDMAGRSQGLYVIATVMFYASLLFYPLCMGSIIYELVTKNK